MSTTPSLSSRRTGPEWRPHITRILSDRNVNIAFMRLFRESRGEKAYTIVESDNRLPEDITEKLLENPNVQDVMLIQP